MKRIFTLGFLLMVFSLLNTTSIFAQPANDEPCNATLLELDPMAPTISSNAGATTSPEERAIVPPTGSFDDFGNCVGGWCDVTGDDGGAGVDHSVWFKFVAPTARAVFIDICGSTFDSQLALYQVGDCADYGTYTYIYSSDDQNACGNFPDANGDGNPEEGLSSTIRIECLNAGEEYYIMVDAWQNTTLDGFIEGNVVIEISTQDEINAGGVTTGPATIASPTCPGEAGGSIDIELINGIAPITYMWSNDSTTQDINGLLAGDYSVTITDFCGSTNSFDYTVVDPAMPAPLSLGMPGNTFVNAFTCLRQGSISLPLVSGTAPFSYEWNDGNTSAYRDSLPDGVYSVTITDGCISGGATLVQEFTVETGGPDDDPTAGDDLTTNEDCAPLTIGFDNQFGSDVAFKVTDNPDQTAGGNIHCRFNADGSMSQSRHWRSFDLSNYSIPNGSTLAGVEVFVGCTANTLANGSDVAYEPGLPVRFYIGYTNTTDLSDPNLQLVGVDSIDVFIPTTDGIESYFVPFPSADDIGGTDLIAVSVETFGVFGIGHFFNLGANESAVDNGAVTYLSGCGLPGILPMEDINAAFIDETIMNLVWTEEGEYTYSWVGDVDDATAATPMTTATTAGTYAVTITDPCGTEFTDEVAVDCWTVSTEELVEASFTISPNPSAGIFQLVNEGASREMLVQVFDLRGQLIHNELMNIGNGSTESLDLSDLAKGIYMAKLSNDNSVESHRLVIQ